MLLLFCCTVSLVKYILAQRFKIVQAVYEVLEDNAHSCSHKPQTLEYYAKAHNASGTVLGCENDPSHAVFLSKMS